MLPGGERVGLWSRIKQIPCMILFSTPWGYKFINRATPFKNENELNWQCCPFYAPNSFVLHDRSPFDKGHIPEGGRARPVPTVEQAELLYPEVALLGSAAEQAEFFASAAAPSSIWKPSLIFYVVPLFILALVMNKTISGNIRMIYDQ
ncbi:hypothetical protein NECAME_06724 [Necator americanus]|uniref:Uncharacterized protein n=1 Tax=Necator americanus TaxID=51031 RepID=W2TRU5_NECAM|nr:hypothetical protein NECAME_06724 [Necator americanus]ETN84760.1 hypothetical protein NECAME_06724 [Necator americanus]